MERVHLQGKDGLAVCETKGWKLPLVITGTRDPKQVTCRRCAPKRKNTVKGNHASADDRGSKK